MGSQVIRSIERSNGYPGWGRSPIVVIFSSPPEDDPYTPVRVDYEILDPQMITIVSRGGQSLDARPGVYEHTTGVLGKIFEVTNRDLDPFTFEQMNSGSIEDQ